MNTSDKKNERLAEGAGVFEDVVLSAPGIASPSVRVAVYGNKADPPRVMDITRDSYGELIEAATASVCKEMELLGSSFPEVVALELISNLVHSGFKSSTVSIVDGGHTLIVSDRGSGIDDVDKACQAGFSTASDHLRRFIRGVGSGLSIVRDIVETMNGSFNIEGNIGGAGAVVTVSFPHLSPSLEELGVDQSFLGLFTERQKKLMLILLENGGAGPSLIAKELGTSISTIHRELIVLEKAKVIESEDRGIRRLGNLGFKVIESFLNENL